LHQIIKKIYIKNKEVFDSHGK